MEFLMWDVGNFTFYRDHINSFHSYFVRTIFLPLVKLCVLSGPSREMILMLHYCTEESTLVWGNVQGKKRLQKSGKHQEYVFVYHNWARKRKE